MKKLIDRRSEREPNRIVGRNRTTRRDHGPVNRALGLRVAGVRRYYAGAPYDYTRRKRFHAATGE